TIADELIAGQRVLLARGDLARAYLADELASRGLQVTDVDVYENHKTDEQMAELIQLLERKDVHIVTFTSSSTVNNLCDRIEAETGRPAAEWLADTLIACIGPKTAETARNRGLDVHRMAAEATIPSLIEAIIAE